MTHTAEQLRGLLREIPDFPSPGVLFRDVTPLLADGEALRSTMEMLVDLTRPFAPTHVVGIESRGFLFGVPVADRLGVGFVPARKQGKLPWKVHQQSYGLEYGTDVLEVHIDGVQRGDRVVIVDDVLATGGTASAAIALVEACGADVVGVVMLVELAFLNGRDRLVAAGVSADLIASLFTY
jgi:adenine phosphoribosyltransferase